MKLSWLNLVSWQVLAGAILIGGIIHIVAVLAVPYVAADVPLRRFAELPVNRMVVLPPTSPTAQPVPFMAPDVRAAVCRFDVSQGPVLVSAVLARPGWTVSLYSQQGDNVYVVPAQEAQASEVNLVVLPPAERMLDIAPQVRSPSAETSSVTGPSVEGLVIVRAPVPGIAWERDIEAILRRASCRQQRP